MMRVLPSRYVTTAVQCTSEITPVTSRPVEIHDRAAIVEANGLLAGSRDRREGGHRLLEAGGVGGVVAGELVEVELGGRGERGSQVVR
jgi:hypothetical protein